MIDGCLTKGGEVTSDEGNLGASTVFGITVVVGSIDLGVKADGNELAEAAFFSIIEAGLGRCLILGF